MRMNTWEGMWWNDSSYTEWLENNAVCSWVFGQWHMWHFSNAWDHLLERRKLKDALHMHARCSERYASLIGCDTSVNHK